MLALFLVPFFHLKPAKLCGQAAVVSLLPAPCLPLADKMKQADLYTEQRNPIFAIPSLSRNFPKKSSNEDICLAE